MPRRRIAKRLAERVDVICKELLPAVGEIDRKKETAAWHEISTIVRHMSKSQGEFHHIARLRASGPRPSYPESYYSEDGLIQLHSCCGALWRNPSTPIVWDNDGFRKGSTHPTINLSQRGFTHAAKKVRFWPTGDTQGGRRPVARCRPLCGRSRAGARVARGRIAFTACPCPLSDHRYRQGARHAGRCPHPHGRRDRNVRQPAVPGGHSRRDHQGAALYDPGA